MSNTYILDALELIFTNAFQISFYDGVLFIILLFALIFSASDYRIGLMTLFITSISAYIFYTLNGFPVVNVTIMVFASLLLLTFSVLLSGKSKQGGVIG